jgi:PKD repeat protein
MARAFFAVWLGICTLAAAGDAASLAPAAENGPSPPLLDCRGSESLPLGGEVLGSTRVHPSRVEHYEVSFDPNETFSGPEAVLFFTNPEVQDIKISLETEGDLSLFLLKDCDERRVVSYGDRRLMLLSLPPGEYYVVVDGRSVEGADFYLKTETGFATTEAGCIQSTPSSLVACPPASAEQPGVVPLYARIVAPEQGAAGGEIHFTDESIGGAKMWTWNFGDETVDVFERNPSHVFQEPGAYVVSLTVSDGQGNASTQYRLVRIEAGPAAGPLAASAAWGEPPEFLGGIATSGGAFTCPSFAGTQFWFARYTELPTFSDPAVEASQPSGLVLINPDVKTAQYVITGPYTASGTIAPQGYESLAFPGDPSGVIVMGEEDTVINKGFQLDVLNDVPILAYYIVPRSINYTQDSYQLIPVQTLGTEYVAANYEEGMGYLPNAAIILASEDATTVTVAHPTCGTRSFTFNRGDVYAYTCNGDLTGALVTSNKPVTVINWRKCTYVGNSCCCDRLIDPALPTNFWDTEYFVSPLPTSSNADAPSRVRVVAKDDNTQVFVNGVLAATLAAGEFYQTQSTQPLHITASQPVQVYQFAMSQSFTGTGDPFMLMAIPNTFYRNNSAFFSYFIYDNFVNIVAPEAATASVLIDGVPPTAAWQTFPDGAPYRWMRQPMAPDLHTVQANAPISTMAYGVGVNPSWISYGHVAGGFSRPIADFSSDSPRCLGQSISFTDASVTADDPLTAWSWDFGDGAGASTLQNPSHTYASPGTYFVTLTVSTDCAASLPVTKTVRVDAIPTAGFVSSSPQCLGADTCFTDISTNDPAEWFWDFGDGVGTSTEQNPCYTYILAGNYAVTLLAKNGCGMSAAYQGTVTVSDTPVADFTAPASFCEDSPVAFADAGHLHAPESLVHLRDSRDAHRNAYRP